MEERRNPYPTADVIIQNRKRQILLINRKYPPYGWALPGGFVDYGESLEDAAVREAKEETGLDIKVTRQFHTYSSPDRDERFHTITTVFIAVADGEPHAADDASDAAFHDIDDLPDNMAFDHRDIIDDFIKERY
ncbi:MAG: NUDIX hydrolase [Nitrospirota bacterium]|nr:MAG: NUDIX hydrolase [Nitrospirota bacterium]